MCAFLFSHFRHYGALWENERGKQMPRTPPRPCRKQGCRNFCEQGQCYCNEHRKENHRNYNKYERNEESSDFYSSTEWRATSKAFREEHPLCEECLKSGRIRPAQLVDHIVPIRQGGAKLDPSNLQSLCNACHSAKSIKEGSRYGND